MFNQLGLNGHFDCSVVEGEIYYKNYYRFLLSVEMTIKFVISIESFPTAYWIYQVLSL